MITSDENRLVAFGTPGAISPEQIFDIAVFLSNEDQIVIEAKATLLALLSDEMLNSTMLALENLDGEIWGDVINKLKVLYAKLKQPELLNKASSILAKIRELQLVAANGQDFTITPIGRKFIQMIKQTQQAK